MEIVKILSNKTFQRGGEVHKIEFIARAGGYQYDGSLEECGDQVSVFFHRGGKLFMQMTGIAGSDLVWVKGKDKIYLNEDNVSKREEEFLDDLMCV